MNVPKSHPRYLSLKLRDNIVAGIDAGITSIHGLIAHGRGESFDYLIGEKTNNFAKKAIKESARLLICANHPVISVNGNAAALVPNELIILSKILNCNLEINIFHTSKSREQKIRKWLIKHGANPKNILLPTKPIIKVGHNRKYANPEGIGKADVVFVPLEDGDRCEALIKTGKKVITVDLNPKSRTAKTATVTIVDNIVRAMPLLIKYIQSIKSKKSNQQKI